MLLRKKVKILKGGFSQFAENLEPNPLGSINIDHVFAIIALKHSADHISLIDLDSKIVEFAESFFEFYDSYMLIAEYANIILERADTDVNVIYGFSLSHKWVFDAIFTFHKTRNEKIEIVEYLNGEFMADGVPINI